MNATAKQRRNWYEFKNQTTKSAELLIYGSIGRSFWGDDDAVSAKQFLKDLKALGDIRQLTVRINSEGGDVFEGNAIHNALKAHKAQVTVSVDGLAASIASVVAMAGDRVVMPENAFLFLHNPSGVVLGTAKDMRKMSEDLDAIRGSLVAAYTGKSGQEREFIERLMDEETWISAEDAKKWGFADEVGEPVQLAAHLDLSRLKNVPESLTAALQPPQAKETLIMSDPKKPAEMTAANPNVATQNNQEPQPFNVVSIEDAKKQGAEEARAAEAARVKSINDICLTAKRQDLAGQFIADGKTHQQVSAELVKIMADASDSSQIQSHVNGLTPGDVEKTKQIQSSWDRAFETYRRM